MMTEATRNALLTVGLAAVAILGCDQDPFGLRDRTVLGNYELYHAEWDAYYLEHKKEDSGGYGVLEGTVGRIGWNDRHIVVWQNPNSGTSGWIVIDSETETLTGPLTDAQLSEIPYVQGIVPISPDAAWRELE